MEESNAKRVERVILLGSLFLSCSIAGAAYLYFRSQQTLAVPADLKVVKLSTEVPAYYDNIFRPQEISSTEFLQNDPITVVRNKPFFPELAGLGPHDLLGFRNRVVPRTADVVTIGDSHTYGNNALLFENWPSVLEQQLSDRQSSVYSMGTGGWAAPQYLEILAKSIIFQPYAIVVAIYSGNDAREALRAVYSVDRFKRFREPGISLESFGSEAFDAASDNYKIKLSEQSEVVFTPNRRLVSNRRSDPAVQKGYQIIHKVLAEMNEIAASQSVKIFITILPTKEFVYSDLLGKNTSSLPQPLADLIVDEGKNISEIEERIKDLKSLRYLDVADHLKQKVFEVPYLYPPDQDGHPLPNGYAEIGMFIASQIKKELPVPPRGLVVVHVGDGRELYYLLGSTGAWSFDSGELVEANGWSKQGASVVPFRAVTSSPLLGRIRESDPARFGPKAAF